MGNEILNQLNAPVMYAIVALAIAGVVTMCIFFLIKSWRAGLRIGMDKAALRRVVVSSATFTVLPAVSILLGVITLSGSMGIPLPWLRLSVIGNLQYEINVADIAARSAGLSGLSIAEMTPAAVTTMALVMTCGILGGALLCVFTLKGYAGKLSRRKPVEPGQTSKSFGDWAMVAMFVGMCATYLGSYIGKAAQADFLPLITAVIAAAAMGVCEVFERKYKMKSLENFDLALSMLVAMAGAVMLSTVMG